MCVTPLYNESNAKTPAETRMDKGLHIRFTLISCMNLMQPVDNSPYYPTTFKIYYIIYFTINDLGVLWEIFETNGLLNF